MHGPTPRTRRRWQGAGPAPARCADRRRAPGGDRRMTIEPAGAVTRERRLANLRATLARPGGPPIGPDQPPARAPFVGRRSPVLAARLAAALGADVAEVA